MSTSSVSEPQPSCPCALERQADRLLVALPRDADCTCYTEGQLAARYRRVVSIHSLEESVLTPPTVAQGDELRFLAGVSRLSPLQRLLVELWADGWSPGEIARKLGHPAWRVSRALRSALRRCFDATPVSFRVFSHHTIYRPPSHVRRPAGSRCARCGEEYLPALGSGRYCSSACRRTAERERSGVPRNRGLTSRTQRGMMGMTITTGREQRNQLDPISGMS